MVQRIGGFRRKSRSKLRKQYREKGKTPLRSHLQEFRKGEKVVLVADSARQGGMYDLKFHGHAAVVEGKQGDCYKVRVRDRGKEKRFIVHPVHLRKT